MRTFEGALAAEEYFMGLLKKIYANERGEAMERACGRSFFGRGGVYLVSPAARWMTQTVPLHPRRYLQRRQTEK